VRAIKTIKSDVAVSAQVRLVVGLEPGTEQLTRMNIHQKGDGGDMLGVSG